MNEAAAAALDDLVEQLEFRCRDSRKGGDPVMLDEVLAFVAGVRAVAAILREKKCP